MLTPEVDISVVEPSVVEEEAVHVDVRESEHDVLNASPETEAHDSEAPEENPVDNGEMLIDFGETTVSDQ